MKILIMSVTCGGGHNSTANAMKDYLTERGVDCRVVDTLGYISRPLARAINDGYLFVTKDIKYGFAAGYRIAEKRRANAECESVARVTNRILSSKMKKYIDEYDPDVIVYTHVFAGVILDVLRTKGKLEARTLGILTDFVFHPFWEECLHLDYVITANELLTYQAKRKGFADTQIIPSGIPINPKFAVSRTKEEARAELGLDLTKKTVLFMGGSMGYGNMGEVVKRLDNIDADFQLIVVCGNNKGMWRELEGLKTKKRMLNLGFVNNVDLLMDASDCIISKPGGLTTSEALAKRLPMIIMNPIPGQEERNTEFLLNNGAALAPSRTFSLEEALWSLLKADKKMDVMRDNIEMLRRPNATADACEFAIKLGNERLDKRKI